MRLGVSRVSACRYIISMGQTRVEGRGVKRAAYRLIEVGAVQRLEQWLGCCAGG